MILREAQLHLVRQLRNIYETREAANIADLVMEHLTGLIKIDRIIHKNDPLLPHNIELLEKYMRHLLAHMPVQYVLHEAWFYGMKLYVDENVLIPRPETEELVEWILNPPGAKQSSRAVKPVVGDGLNTNYPDPEKKQNINEDQRTGDLTIFEIGTGSGCISIALKKQLPSAIVYACDISKKALEVAQRNAADQRSDIGFLHMNFLDPVQWDLLPLPDIIVSNPPYVPWMKKATIQANVLEFEPHLALFPDENDPLIFYHAIADFGKKKMKPNGVIYVEIHEDSGTEVEKLFTEKGFADIELKKDMQGKNRMVRVAV